MVKVISIKVYEIYWYMLKLKNQYMFNASGITTCVLKNNVMVTPTLPRDKNYRVAPVYNRAPPPPKKKKKKQMAGRWPADGRRRWPAMCSDRIQMTCRNLLDIVGKFFCCVANCHQAAAAVNGRLVLIRGNEFE